MATLMPSLSSVKRRMTSGEKRFAERLESHLEDDYLCWYDVPVGSRGIHPDFIILHPRRGVLILEVKDWKRDTIRSIDRHSATLLTQQGIKRMPNPLEQARAYAHAVNAVLERDPALVCEASHPHAGKLCFPWGYGVVLTNITRKVFDEGQLDEVLLADRVICQDEMTEGVDSAQFQERLWKMFTVHFPTVLTLPQVDRIRWHLFPDIRITVEQPQLALQPGPAEQEGSHSLPDLLMVMDLQQEQLARSLGEGHRVIHGVAGSGKTMILGYRAAYLAQAISKPILVLCYNAALAAKLEHFMAERNFGEKVLVRNFHRWCVDQLKLYHVPKPPEGDGFYDRLVEAVIDAVDRGQIPRAQYGAVLIDEGHDFRPEWLKLVVQMVDPATNLFLLMYDDAQNIYGEKDRRNFSFKSVGIQAQGRTTILKLNYRNTAEVLQVAHEFARNILTPQEAGDDGIPLIAPETAGRHGPLPEFVSCDGADAERKTIAARVKDFHTNGAEWREIAVLCPTNFAAQAQADALNEADIPALFIGARKDSRRTAPDVDQVRVMTLHSSKGLEFPVVLINGIGSLPNPKSTPVDDARLLYVGMTRAMVHLVMTSHADSEFSARLRSLGNLAMAG